MALPELTACTMCGYRRDLVTIGDTRCAKCPNCGDLRPCE